MEPSFKPQTAPQENFNTQPPETKVYTYSKLKLLPTHGLAFLMITLICLIISILIWAGAAHHIFSIPQLIISAVISAVISAALVALHIYIFISKRIEVNINGITFYRNRKKFSFYPLSGTQFTTHVKMSTSYGTVTDVSRTLDIYMNNGKKTKESFQYFSKDTLSEVYEDIKNLRQYGKFDNIDNSVTPEVNIPNALQASFTIPKQQLINAERKNILTPAHIVISSIAITVILPFLLYFLRVIPSNWIPWAMLFLAIFCPAIFIFERIQSKDVIGSYPEYIALYTDHIQIDNAVFPINTITKITMTPTSYKQMGHARLTTNSNYTFLSHRYLTIFTQNGKTEYTLGRTGAAQKDQIFEDYGSLHDSVEHWCFDHKITYTENLG